MTSQLKFALALTLVALALAPLVASMDITVKVVDKHDDSITGAKIVITNSTGGCNITSSSSGKTCSNLNSDDNYDITVTKSNYRDFSGSFDSSDLDSDDVLKVVMGPERATLDVHVVKPTDADAADIEVTIKSLDVKLTEDDFSDWVVILFPDDESNYVAFSIASNADSDTTSTKGLASFDELDTDTDYTVTLKKSPYLTATSNFTFDDTVVEDGIELKLVEPGQATFRAIVKDQETGVVIPGAAVAIVSTGSGTPQTEDTNSQGIATFTLATPDCYDVTVSKANYDGDTQENLCFENNDAVNTPFYMVSQNQPPVANAGADKFVMAGDLVALDGSASSDINGDVLSYSWSDSLSTPIPSVASPAVNFTTAGEHTLTLTVSDGKASSTDEVMIVVDSPENCGNSICSLSENATKTCPVDCPVCLDSVAGAGENDPASSLYCPIDWSIPVKILMINETQIVVGNATEISVVDPMTGVPLIGAIVEVVSPNGTAIRPTMFMGKAQYAFTEGGTYNITAAAPKYAQLNMQVKLSTGMDLSWLMWVAIIALIAVAAVFVMRNLPSFGGNDKGYRAKKFRRRKPTLSRL